MAEKIGLSDVSLALEALRAGRMVILVDDEERENEGDLVLAAEAATPEAINFMVTHARRYVSLDSERVDALGIPQMADGWGGRNRSSRSTAFTVSIEAREGVTTGISAADRAHTIRVAVDPSTTSDDW